MRHPSILASAAVLAAVCSMLMGGCGEGTQAEDSSNPALRGGGLGSEPPTPDESGLITICHVPPGNPSNAHTLTIGASGWNGHRHHKKDYLGPCEGGGSPDAGTPPPPTDGGTDPDPTPDAGPQDPTCAPEGSTCGSGVPCCSGLQCQEGYCGPIIG